MPRPALLLLHEIFPTFPSFWTILLVGAVLGGGITMIVRRGRRSDARVREIGVTARQKATRREGILGVPWAVPGYTLIAVVAGGLLGLVFPPLELLLVPGFVALFAIAMSASGTSPDVPEIFAPLIIGGVSWLFWTVCAAAVWKLVEGPSGEPRRRPGDVARLDLGKKRD
ncbi:MAG: hypothetical protein HOQ11_12210 [Gemmatimonadaceae bacterium]|nr:hypothetical protein [Gemmatimonadaceae bacterium]NUQ93499.1 hypothetical protein [Gemmatimonadaceae bacterium]NUR19685.1 hypothetical protein [Gemmatimonadaceae bacterium]NUS98158.1 hypothetical protein [Gemmatimonadaceae bacterium]